MLGPVGRKAFAGLLASPPAMSSASSVRCIQLIAQARCISTARASNAIRQELGHIKRPQSHSRYHLPRRTPTFVARRYQHTAEIPSSAQTQNLPPPRRSLIVRILATFGLFCVFTPLGFYFTAGTPLTKTLKEMENIPTDEETLGLVAPPPSDPAHDINQFILNNPLAQELFANPKFIASRPHMKIPPSLRQNSFTAGTLTGPDMMPVPALVFATKDGTELVQILYVGQALCGHPGLVHGGMLATLMDEGLARCCFPGLPNKVGVTASLKIDYRTPCKADQYIVLKCETTKFEGRKAWVKGRIETLPQDGSKPVLITEGEALFIEPRNAGILSRQRKIVGGDE